MSEDSCKFKNLCQDVAKQVILVESKCIVNLYIQNTCKRINDKNTIYAQMFDANDQEIKQFQIDRKRTVVYTKCP